MILTSHLSRREGGGGIGLCPLPPPFPPLDGTFPFLEEKSLFKSSPPPGLLHSPFLCENPGYAPVRDNTLSWNRNRKVA